MPSYRPKKVETDIRKVGSQSYRDLQRLNQQKQQAGQEYMMKTYGVNRLSTPGIRSHTADVWEGDFASPIAIQSNYKDYVGNSYWDKDNYTVDDLDLMQKNPDELRAQNQSGFMQVVNGVGKMVGLAGSTFLNSTLGLITGLGQGLYNAITGENDGSFVRGLWDNAVTASLEEFNKNMESWMPNYYTQAEKEAPWYENIFTANFFGDKLLKNMGFTIGAIGAAYVTGGLGLGSKIGQGLAKLGAGARTIETTSGIANRVINGVVSAAGEASIEAYNSVHDGMERYENQLNIYYQENQQRLQQEYEQDLQAGVPEDQAKLIYDKGIQELQEGVQKSRQEYLKTTTDNGNAVFGMNMAVLSISNNLEFGRAMKGGWGSQKMLEQAYKKGSKDIARTVDGKIIGNTMADDIAFGKALAQGKAGYTNIAKEPTKKMWALTAGKNALSEGSEEGLQRLISDTNQMRAQAIAQKESKDKGYLGYSLDPDITDAMINYTDALNHAWQESFGTAESAGWEEVALGALTGILGVPTLGRRKSGKLGLTWQGGFMEDYKDTRERYDRINNTVDELNQHTDTSKLRKMFQRAVANVSINQRQRQALFEDDHFTFKNNQLAGVVNTALGIRDGLDSGLAYKSMIEEMATTVTDKDVEEFKQAMIAETGDKDVYAGKSNDEIREMIQTNFQKLNQLLNRTLDNYDKLKNDEKVQQLSEPAFEELLYSYSLAENMEERITRINEENAKLNASDPIERKQIEKNNRDLARLEEDKKFLNKRVENALNNPESFNKLIEEKVNNYQKAAIANQLQVQVEAVKNADNMESIAQIVAFLDEQNREAVLEKAYNEGSDTVKQNIDNFRKFQDDAEIVEVALNKAFDNLEEETRISISNTPEGKMMLRVLEQQHINDKREERGEDLEEEYSAEQQEQDLKDFNPLSIENLENLEQHKQQLIELLNSEESGLTDDQKVSMIQVVNGIDSVEDMLLQLARQKNAITDLYNALYEDIVLRDKIGENTSIADGIRQTIDTLERDQTLDENTKQILLSTLDELQDNEKLQSIKDLIKKRKDELEKQRRLKEERERQEAERKKKAAEENKKSEEGDKGSTATEGVNKYTISSLLDLVNETASPKLTLTDNVLKSGLEIIVGDKSADRNAGFPNGDAITSSWKELRSNLNVVRKAFDPNSRYSDAVRNNIKDQIKQIIEGVDKGFVIYNDGAQAFLEMLNIVMNDEMLQWFTNYKATDNTDNGVNDNKEPVAPPTTNVDALTKPNDFSGNQFRVEYDMLERFEHILKPVDINRWPVIKRMYEDGVRPQWFIDNILGRIYKDNPEIKIRFVSSGKDIIYLALKREDINKYIPNTNNISILDTNDGEYVAIGTLGLLNNATNKNIYNELLNKLVSEFNANNGQNKFYVNTELYTQINNYLSGEFIYETPEHPQGEFNFIRDLLDASSLSINDLAFCNIMGSEEEGTINIKPIRQKNGNVYYRPETTSTGQTFIYIESGMPNVWVPVKLKTVSWNDITRINRTGTSEGQENPYLYNSIWYKEEVRKPIETLFSDAEQTDKIAAIAKLRDNLLFNKNQTGDAFRYSIKYDENTDTVQVFINRKWSVVSSADELEQAFTKINPRVNIKNTELENNPQLYIDAGILQTDVKFLHTMKSTFYVKGLNENFKVIEGKADMTKQTPEPPKNTNEPLYINEKTFYQRDEGVVYSDGEPLTDEDAELVRQLQAVQNFGQTFEDKNNRNYLISSDVVFEKNTNRSYTRLEGNRKKKVLKEFQKYQQEQQRRQNRQRVEEKKEDTVGGSPVALSYLLDGGPSTIQSTGYLLHAISAAFEKITSEIEDIRSKYLEKFDDKPENFKNDSTGALKEIRDAISNAYGQKGLDILNKILDNATGFYAREGKQIEAQLEELNKSIQESYEEETSKPSIAATVVAQRKRDTKGFKPIQNQSQENLGNSGNNDTFAGIKSKAEIYARKARTNDSYFTNISQFLGISEDELEELQPDTIAKKIATKLTSDSSLTPENIAQITEASEDQISEILNNIINCH